MIKETGGPAFPVDANEHGFPPHLGMTLRDYFAAKAMQGQIATDWDVPREVIAQWCYRMADAMLEARK